MLQIPCPFCGVRDETEFHCGGEAHIERPLDPAAATDSQWADYQFNRHNKKGMHLERWQHVHGCRTWFNAARDTVSHKFIMVYPMGEAAPSNEQLENAAASQDDVLSVLYARLERAVSNKALSKGREGEV